jgi:hypothetical protein
VDARLEQRILDVDVADPGDPLLVQQEGLDHAASAPQLLI